MYAAGVLSRTWETAHRSLRSPPWTVHADILPQWYAGHRGTVTSQRGRLPSTPNQASKVWATVAGHTDAAYFDMIR